MAEHISQPGEDIVEDGAPAWLDQIAQADDFGGEGEVKGENHDLEAQDLEAQEQRLKMVIGTVLDAEFKIGEDLPKQLETLCKFVSRETGAKVQPEINAAIDKLAKLFTEAEKVAAAQQIDIDEIHAMPAFASKVELICENEVRGSLLETLYLLLGVVMQQKEELSNKVVDVRQSLRELFRN